MIVIAVVLLSDMSFAPSPKISWVDDTDANERGETEKFIMQHLEFVIQRA